MKNCYLKMGLKLIQFIMLCLWLISLGCPTEIEAQLLPDFKGQVLDDATNNPIQNATIILSTPYSGTVYATATTDLNGHYEFYGLTGLQSHTYLVKAVGYESQSGGGSILPVALDFRLVAPASGYLVDAIDGYRNYKFNGLYNYRTDGVVRDNWDYNFPGIDESNPDVDTLLFDIVKTNQTTTTTTTDPGEIWLKCKTTWEWLRDHTCQYSSCPDAWSYFMGKYYEGSYIDALAQTYKNYNIIPLGTCFNQADTYTTLLYRIGVPKDNLAIAGTNHIDATQHWYTIIYLKDRWLYLDTFLLAAAFPPFENFYSIPAWTPGYRNPFTIAILPNSSLGQVPELTNRSSNTFNVFIANVPDGTVTTANSVDIVGFTQNQNISEVIVNGSRWPIVGSVFQGNVPLTSGENLITAEVVDGVTTYQDSILVRRAVLTSNNNFTMNQADGSAIGGANDVIFSWDGSLKTSVDVSGQVPNATLSSHCPIWDYLSAHDVAVYGPGTYTVYTDCPAGSPGCEDGSGNGGTPITFTVNSGELGVHMLFDWNGSNNMDVVNVWQPNAVFGPSPMWTGDCGSNQPDKVWDWISKDWDLDGINGAPIIDGLLSGWIINFNVMGLPQSLCDGSETLCNDNNVCTTDTCDPATGNCIHTYNALPCNDGNACTVNDVCSTGTCAGTAIVCNDNNVCTIDSCNSATGCVFMPTVPAQCNDNDICTSDGCFNNTCTHTPTVPTQCNDINICTIDGCSNNTCTHTPTVPAWCNDNNICTIDGCSNNVCTHTATVPASCNDNNACTTDGCTINVCTHTAVFCNDNNVCTTDTCNTATGCVFTPTVPASCNDNNACTSDGCTSNACTHTAVVCNDNNACTTDICNTSTGCVFTQKNCNDNNACTTDSCNTATGACVHTTIVCNDNNACTTDTCNTSTGCVYTTMTCPTNQSCDPTTGVCDWCYPNVTIVGGGGTTTVDKQIKTKYTVQGTGCIKAYTTSSVTVRTGTTLTYDCTVGTGPRPTSGTLNGTAINVTTCTGVANPLTTNTLYLTNGSGGSHDTDTMTIN